MEKAVNLPEGVNHPKRRKGFEDQSDEPAFHPLTVNTFTA